MNAKSMLGSVVGKRSENKAPGSLGTDTIHDVLRNERRRVVVELLRERNEMRMCDVIDRVAEHEFGRPISDIGGPERKRIYVSLVQCHVPKLWDEGVIELVGAETPSDEFDSIRPGANIAALYPYLDVEDTPVLRRMW